MLVVERQQLILEQLRRKGTVSVRELARTIGSPDVTVRRDLTTLARGGLVRRTRGGATVSMWPGTIEADESPATPPSHEELAIAYAARELIQTGDTIVIAGGPTTLALALQLVNSVRLTIVTNSLAIAGVFRNAHEIEVHVAGGLLCRPSMELIGLDSSQALRGLRATSAFISADGITARHGLSSSSFAAAGSVRVLASAANRVVGLVDHTKVGTEAPFQMVPCSIINDLITGSGADAVALEQIQEAGVSVRIAE